MVDKTPRIRYYAVITMAEVADFISTVSVWQLPGQEREARRRICLVPNGMSWACAEDVQDCHPHRMEC